MSRCDGERRKTKDERRKTKGEVCMNCFALLLLVLVRGIVRGVWDMLWEPLIEIMYLLL